MFEHLQGALHQKTLYPLPNGNPWVFHAPPSFEPRDTWIPSLPARPEILALAMQVLLHACHSPILIRLIRLSIQEKEIAPLLGPLGLVALLLGLGAGYLLSVLCFQSLQMVLLIGYWLIVELGVVPGTIRPGCCSPLIASSLGLLPKLGVLISFTEAHWEDLLSRVVLG